MVRERDRETDKETGHINTTIKRERRAREERKAEAEGSRLTNK